MLSRIEANILEGNRMSSTATARAGDRRLESKVKTCLAHGPPDTAFTPSSRPTTERRTAFLCYLGSRFLRGRERAEPGGKRGNSRTWRKRACTGDM